MEQNVAHKSWEFHGLGGIGHPPFVPIIGAGNGWTLDRQADAIETKTGNRLLDDYGLIFR